MVEAVGASLRISVARRHVDDVRVLCWVIWFWLLISIFSDLFRRDDVGGWVKAGWVVLLVVLPFLGVLIYLIANTKGMAERRNREAKAYQEQFDAHVRSVAAKRELGERAFVLGGPDRQGQAAAGQRRHQPGGVRHAQAEGAGLSRADADRSPRPQRPPVRCVTSWRAAGRRGRSTAGTARPR